MFYQRSSDNHLRSAGTVLELIYHNTVRTVRRTHANALVAILMSILQTIVMVMAFYFLFVLLGIRGAAIRGDFLLYIMSGIFLYMVHVRTVQAVIGSEGPASAMMKHAPMNTAIAIASSALGALYVQILSILVILYVYHVGWNPITIYFWPGAMGMVILSWFTGIAVGLIFLALKPWFPGFVSIGSTIYSRANMLASGKTFVANQLPATMLPIFDWNPLFHAIDQARGYTFINYFPHNSSISYPIYIGLVLLMVGLMGEFYTRKRASLSWEARR